MRKNKKKNKKKEEELTPQDELRKLMKKVENIMGSVEVLQTKVNDGEVTVRTGNSSKEVDKENVQPNRITEAQDNFDNSVNQLEQEDQEAQSRSVIASNEEEIDELDSEWQNIVSITCVSIGGRCARNIKWRNWLRHRRKRKIVVGFVCS